VKWTNWPKDGPDARELDHQPPNLIPFRHEAPGLVGEVHQDRAGFELRV
jgi:hypothetical protein